MKTLLLLLISFLTIAQNAAPCESIVFHGNHVLLEQAENFPVLLDTGILESFPALESNQSRCDVSFESRRGYDFFRKSNACYRFNFEDRLLCRLDEKQVTDLLKTGYAEIKSGFNRQGVSIYLTISRKDYAFRFDTGYIGSFCMSYSDKIPFIKDSRQSMENIQGTTDFVYANKWISMNKTYYSGIVTVSQAGESKVGMAFLKGFDWILDFDKQKVYFKKNGTSLENIERQDYEAAIHNGNLTVVSKNAKAKEHQLGDVITTVNGQKVLPENICEILDLLTKTNHWELLQIETVKNE